MCRNISSCAETSRYAKNISRMQEKTSHKIRAKFAQNSCKNYIIETRKIKKVHARCENGRTFVETVLYILYKISDILNKLSDILIQISYSIE